MICLYLYFTYFYSIKRCRFFDNSLEKNFNSDQLGGDDDDFECPMCSTLGNCLVPICRGHMSDPAVAPSSAMNEIRRALSLTADVVHRTCKHPGKRMLQFRFEMLKELWSMGAYSILSAVMNARWAHERHISAATDDSSSSSSSVNTSTLLIPAKEMSFLCDLLLSLRVCASFDIRDSSGSIAHDDDERRLIIASIQLTLYGSISSAPPLRCHSVDLESSVRVGYMHFNEENLIGFYFGLPLLCHDLHQLAIAAVSLFSRPQDVYALLSDLCVARIVQACLELVPNKSSRHSGKISKDPINNVLAMCGHSIDVGKDDVLSSIVDRVIPFLEYASSLLEALRMAKVYPLFDHEPQSGDVVRINVLLRKIGFADSFETIIESFSSSPLVEKWCLQYKSRLEPAAGRITDEFFCPRPIVATSAASADSLTDAVAFAQNDSMIIDDYPDIENIRSLHGMGGESDDEFDDEFEFEFDEEDDYEHLMLHSDVGIPDDLKSGKLWPYVGIFPQNEFVNNSALVPTEFLHRQRLSPWVGSVSGLSLVTDACGAVVTRNGIFDVSHFGMKTSDKGKFIDLPNMYTDLYSKVRQWYSLLELFCYILHPYSTSFTMRS